MIVINNLLNIFYPLPLLTANDEVFMCNYVHKVSKEKGVKYFLLEFQFTSCAPLSDLCELMNGCE